MNKVFLQTEVTIVEKQPGYIGVSGFKPKVMYREVINGVATDSIFMLDFFHDATCGPSRSSQDHIIIQVNSTGLNFARPKQFGLCKFVEAGPGSIAKAIWRMGL